MMTPRRLSSTTPQLRYTSSRISAKYAFITQGISEVVRILLSSGCFSVDCRDHSDKTPLHYAALNGADEVFQLLVENKADIDALDAVGATPLHFAVR